MMKVSCPHLNALVQRYLSWATEEQINLLTDNKSNTKQTNQDAINAAKFNHFTDKDRTNTIGKWLGQYGVLQGDKLRENTDAISTAILKYFKASPNSVKKASHVMRQYESLNSVIRVAGLETRSLLSLTSKALWCRYPNDTPIYDRNAVVALWSLVRLRHDAASYAPEVHDARRPKGIRANQTKVDCADYEVFLINYLALYEEIKPKINEYTKTKSYPYAIRVFDKMLWAYGSKSRDIPERKSIYQKWKP